MLIKDVVRGKVLSELIAEQAECILNQHQEIVGLQKDLKAVQKTIEEKDALLVAYENKAKGE